jgi:hypothetical protein
MHAKAVLPFIWVICAQLSRNYCHYNKIVYYWKSRIENISYIVWEK